MGKRLIFLLTLVFAVGIAFAAYAEVQNVKVSGDADMFYAHRDLSMKGNKNDQTSNFFASTIRARIDADLTDNVSASIRLLNERYWGRDDENGPDGAAVTTSSRTSNGHNTDINLDLAYVALKEFLYSPLSVIVGRQEIHLGNDMIVGDVDTNNQATTAGAFGGAARDPDLTKRKAFDAIRATLDYNPLMVDIIYAKTKTNDNLKIWNDDTNLYGVNANYVFSKKLIGEAYFFVKDIGKKALRGSDATEFAADAGTKKTDRVNAVGGRVVAKPIENLTFQLESAYQFGERPIYATDSALAGANNGSKTVARSAWALETALGYDFKKIKYTPNLTALYAYFSGQPSDIAGAPYVTGTYRGWDPMYENQKFGDIANVQFDQTNAHIVGGILTAKPLDDISLKGEYYAFWWAKAYPNQVQGTNYITTRRGDRLVMNAKSFVGSELDLTASYDYTEDVQFGLMGGWFFPGAALSKGNDSTAVEVIGSMKVTF